MLLMAVVMCLAVLLVGHGCAAVGLHDIVPLMIQVFVGVAVYLLLSVMVKPKSYRTAMEMERVF